MTSESLHTSAPTALIAIEGADAVAFAQAQFSSDVDALAVGGAQLSAWLDPQGRARHVFVLLRPSVARLVAWQPLGSADEMAVQLRRYVFRSKASISVVRDFAIRVGDESAVPSPGNQVEFVATLPGNGSRRVEFVHCAASPDGPSAAPAIGSAWTLADVRDGLPWLATELAGEFVAPALGLAAFSAASTTKGCYPGQEIVARLHFRGGNKRHCHHVLIASGEAPPPGAKVVAPSVPGQHGRILYGARADADHGEALAVLSEALSVAPDLTLESGQRVSLARVALALAPILLVMPD